jgi:hypothetical protein
MTGLFFCGKMCSMGFLDCGGSSFWACVDLLLGLIVSLRDADGLAERRLCGIFATTLFRIANSMIS